MTKDSNAINLNLIDQLLADYKTLEDVLGENGLLKQLTKAVSNVLSKPNSLITLAMKSITQPAKTLAILVTANLKRLSKAISVLCPLICLVIVISASSLE